MERHQLQPIYPEVKCSKLITRQGTTKTDAELERMRTMIAQEAAAVAARSSSCRGRSRDGRN